MRSLRVDEDALDKYLALTIIIVLIALLTGGCKTYRGEHKSVDLPFPKVQYEEVEPTFRE